ncbi:S8 family serine peptidase [Plantactinospora sonchi]|uniref:S8 family serine peptidase n=1 Tax=Plantactinospora sonchi TaxID=1544735 RepID=A0ABU7RRX2_9ACTN
MQDGTPPPPDATSPGPAVPPYPPPVGATGASPWPVVAAVLVGVWTVGVTVGAQALGWLGDQLVLVAGLDRPAWLWPAVGLGNALLVGVPAGLLAALPRSPAVRATGRAWLLGTVTLGVLLALRALPPTAHEAYLAGFAATVTLATVLIRRLGGRPDGPGWSPPAALRRRAGQPERQPDEATPGRAAKVRFRTEPAILLGVAAGLSLLLPWVWVGALGGTLETVLALLAAATVGRLAATVLDSRFWAAFTPDSMVRGRGGPVPAGSRTGLVLLGGLVAGVALTLLAAGTGQSGTSLAVLLVLPPTGFAIAALHAVSGQRPDGTAAAGAGTAGGWLVGVAAVGPLAFADPEEITLLLAVTRDVPYWAAVAALGSLAVAVLLGLGYGVGLGRSGASLPRRPVAVAVAAALLLGTGVVYVGVGSPGWHGERLFVVLRQQADLTGVAGTGGTGPAGREARAREVYRRLVDTAEASQTGLRRELDRLRLNHTPYYLVNAIETDGGPAVRAWLSRRDDVARVLVSQRLRPVPAGGSPMGGDAPAPRTPGWNLTMISADRVRSELGVDGTGIVVGSSDSGVDGTHPALAPGFRGGADSWHDPWNGSRAPVDHGGHGTHTLATAVGGEQVGVAPGARWVGCVNLDRNLGNPADYLDCLQFMLAPYPPGADPFTAGRPERAPQVLTNSWGCPPIEGCARETLRPAAAALASAGVFFVAAAGNTGPFCGSLDDPPAPYPEVFTVGATDRNRQVAFFSSRGPAPGGTPKPDLVAPGDEVLSALPGGGYGTQSGTSMAAPHVAGVVALMWSANPALVGDLETTGRILRDTATPVDPTFRSGQPADDCGAPSHVSGAGIVDAYAAVRTAQQLGQG